MIALIFGERSSNFAESLMSASDIKGVVGYTSIGQFLTEASRKALRCERIVFNSVAVGSEQELINLHQYLQEHLRSTEVVLLNRSFETMDVEIVSAYYNHFSLPIYTDYSLGANEQMGIQLLAKLCKAPIDDIRVGHSSKKDNRPVVRYVQDEVAQKVDSKPAFVPPAPIKKPAGVIKSFTYGGGVFRKKRLTKAQQAMVEVVEQEASAMMQIGG